MSKLISELEKSLQDTMKKLEKLSEEYNLAWDKIEELAEEYRKGKEEKVSYSQAIKEVLATEEGKILYRKYLESR